MDNTMSNMNNMNMRQNPMIQNPQYYMHGGYPQGSAGGDGMQAGMPGGMGGGVMNPVGMQPSHMQQHPQQLGPNAGMVGVVVPQQQTQGMQMGPNPGQQPPQIMQQQMNVQPAPTASSMMTISQPNPHKEINIVALSRLGQETVQDITSRFQEIFSALKVIQPTAIRDNNNEKKVQEYFRTIRLLFKRVRIIYEKCNDGYPQGMEYTHVESLIPYRDEPDHRIEPTQCEEYRKALQENQELIETVKLKNRQLREIIDRTRIIIWEINTMLSMRRS